MVAAEEGAAEATAPLWESGCLAWAAAGWRQKLVLALHPPASFLRVHAQHIMATLRLWPLGPAARYRPGRHAGTLPA